MRIRDFIVIMLVLMLSAALTVKEADAGPGKYSRSVVKYTMPDVTLVNQDGKKVRLQDFVNTDKPVIVDFIFCTCTTICPVLSANLTNFQERLGPEASKVQLLSISIDPEHDTPKLMKEYLKRYRAKEGWTYLTGTRAAIDQVLKAFSAPGSIDKMLHSPLLFLRDPASGQWVRIEGLIGTSILIEEYKKIIKN